MSRELLFHFIFKNVLINYAGKRMRSRLRSRLRSGEGAGSRFRKKSGVQGVGGTGKAGAAPLGPVGGALPA